MFESISLPVLTILAGIFLILLGSTLFVQLPKFKDQQELKLRVRSWWFIIIIFTIALLASKPISIIFFALLSFLALKEYLSLIPTRRADRRVLFWAYLAIPIHYYWVAIGWYGMFVIFIPVYVFLFLPFRMILVGETKEFLRAMGTLHWGMMTMVFSLSHVAYFFSLPSQNNPAGGAGLVLFLVLLTELNDIAQYVWGKCFGKHKIVPKISPKKTIEGFIGGVLTTISISPLIASMLTPLSLVEAFLAGLIIGISGFIGDVTISALKRDIGVKDSGALIPGHGGILDRIDSLTYSAPLFFHFIYYLHF